jgi:hypothetical protein
LSLGILSSEYAFGDNENGRKFSGEPEEFTFRRQLKCSGDISDFNVAAGYIFTPLLDLVAGP